MYVFHFQISIVPVAKRMQSTREQRCFGVLILQSKSSDVGRTPSAQEFFKTLRTLLFERNFSFVIVFKGREL